MIINTRIMESIRGYRKSNMSSYHTPGHKGKLSKYDITELEYLDFPINELKTAERDCREIYSADHLRFLVGGSSMGVKAEILAVGGDIIAPKNCHQSVIEGVRLAKCKAYYIENTVVDGLKMPLSESQVELYLDKYPTAKAVLVTSPDYYGFVAPLEGISKLVKERGKILIVDSAHGAHFAFSSHFPTSAVKNADMTNMSCHKTLCSLTQSAVVVCKSEFIGALNEAITLLSTTSPSYLLLASCEYGIKKASESSAKYDKLFERITRLKAQYKFVENDDFTRLVLDSGQYSMTGKQLYDMLWQSGVAPEMHDERYVVLIATIANARRDITKLAKALKRIEKN